MTVVYIDMLFLLNLTANYLLLLAGGRMAGAVLRRPLIAVGAAVGAGYAAVLFLPGLGWLAGWPCKVGVGVLMSLIAFGGCGKLLRPTVMFFCASAALAGTVLAAQLLGSGPLSMENGVLYSHLDLRLLLVLFVLCYFVLSLFFRRIAAHGVGELLDLRIHVLGQEIRLTALRDTGNTLTDPATNRPVVVAEAAALAGALPEGVEAGKPIEAMERLREAGIRGRLLPYRAVGTDCGLLVALRAERVTANGKELGPLLVALSPGPVGDGGDCRGLIGGI